MKKIILGLALSSIAVLAQPTEKEIFAGYYEACNLGQGKWCNALGHIYSKENKPQKAYEYYVKSCDLKSAEGCMSVAYHFQKKEAHIMAREYFDEACELDGKVGCEEKNTYNKEASIKEDKVFMKKFYALMGWEYGSEVQGEKFQWTE